MEFEVVGGSPSHEYDRKVILNFLSTIDPAQLSAEVLDSFGWGQSGDPITVALEVLKSRV